MTESPWQPFGPVRRRADALFVKINDDSWLGYTQNTQWQSLLLDGPTKTIATGSMQGNDFPGAYYFDGHSRRQFIAWVTGPAPAVDWRRLRFEVRMEEPRIGESAKRRIGEFPSPVADSPLAGSGEGEGGEGGFIFGVFARTAEALPPELNFEVISCPRASVPDPWQALRVLIDTSFEHWPLPAVEGEAPDWTAMAEQTLADLGTTRCQISVAGPGPLPARTGESANRRAGDVRNESLAASPIRPLADSSSGGVPSEIGYTAYAIGTGHLRSVPQPHLELFVQTDLALSLTRYAQASGNTAAGAEAGRLRQLLRRFFNPENGFLENHYPPADFTLMDFSSVWPPPDAGAGPRRVFNSWYQLHNLHRVLETARISGDAELAELGWRALETASRFVRSMQYLLPIWADWAPLERNGETANGRDGEEPVAVSPFRRFADSGTRIGGGLDLYAGGLFALCLMTAAELKPERAAACHAEAIHAIEVMRALPPGIYVHEPIALAGCVEAADRLANAGAGGAHQTAVEWRDDFLRLLLMMLYREPRGGPYTGMFQACGGLLYPAFKENVESILPLIGLLAPLDRTGETANGRDGEEPLAVSPFRRFAGSSKAAPPAPAQLPIRAIIEHQLRGNRAYFDDTEPRGIPYEDLPTTELPGPGSRLGKEVYGAGQVFDLALVQRALAHRGDETADKHG